MEGRGGGEAQGVEERHKGSLTQKNENLNKRFEQNNL
jgi:hypothetical protein